MAPQIEPRGAETSGSESTALPQITAQETVPGRMVFTETDNTDGWIATDLVLDPVAHR